MCNKDCVAGSKDYYKRGGKGGVIEVIDIIEMYGLDFSLGNAIKYILRCGVKGGSEDSVEDLVKAVWYINRAMEGKVKSRVPIEINISAGSDFSMPYDGGSGDDVVVSMVSPSLKKLYEEDLLRSPHERVTYWDTLVLAACNWVSSKLCDRIGRKLIGLRDKLLVKHGVDNPSNGLADDLLRLYESIRAENERLGLYDMKKGITMQEIYGLRSQYVLPIEINISAGSDLDID